MFTTTHDVVLLAIAALYLVIVLIRTTNQHAAISRGLGGRIPRGYVTVPVLISFSAFIAAVLW